MLISQSDNNDDRVYVRPRTDVYVRQLNGSYYFCLEIGLITGRKVPVFFSVLRIKIQLELSS